jgi:hypothetical protein
MHRCVLFPQPSPPTVESVLGQTSSKAVGTDRLPARFLLRDPLAPLLAPLFCFVHFSTMPGSW